MGSSALGIFDAAYFPEASNSRSSSYKSPVAEINQEIRRTNVAAAVATQGQPVMAAVQDSLDDGVDLGSGGNSGNSDPWEASFLDTQDPLASQQAGGDTTNEEGSVCACKINRRASRSSWAGPRSPKRTSMKGGGMYQQRRASGELVSPDTINDTTAAEAAALCPTCGKKRPLDLAGFAWAKSRPYAFSSAAGGTGAAAAMVGEDPDEPRHARALLHSTPQLRLVCPASTDMQGAGNVSSPHFLSLVIQQAIGENKVSRDAAGNTGGLSEYRASLVRDRANDQASAELASLLWVLAHEMSLEDYGAVESQVFTAVFALVHAADKERRMAGLAALDALLAAPSADEEKKAIKFANTLSTGLRAADGDFEFLSAVSKALGHMAERTANMDFVESEVTRALEWLRTERSDRRYDFKK